ncbi:uncharacterized protein LOC119733132 [Patiria miniata]|uniref:SET domain-containing protein n=1 Tax=Patiria miniata TaxID=46514 RepID=A0A914AFY3_PATMI|nr:uncharacterized protein LOC119733132 [Patiria miniata]XP_038062637.1 uncharacterized protein LOC119733132 [Patiria miniata]
MPFLRKRISPLAEAKQFCGSGTDKRSFQQRYINDIIGYGLFTTTPFQQGDFLLEYRGQVSQVVDNDEASNMYEFIYQHNGVDYRVDASHPDSCQARYINDEPKQPNCKMKKIVIDNSPHLCLFALHHIDAGQELRYDYGPDDFPWREANHGLDSKKLCTKDSFTADSTSGEDNASSATLIPLKCNQGFQTTQLNVHAVASNTCPTPSDVTLCDPATSCITESPSRADSAVGLTLVQNQSTSLQSLPYSDHSSPHVDASNTCQTPSDVTLCDPATSCITESPSRADSAVGPTLIQDQSTSLQSLPYLDHSSSHVDASNTCPTPSDVTLCDPATSCITESPSRADSAVGPTLIPDQSTSLQSLPYSDHSSPHVDAINTCQTPSDVTLCDPATSCITESPSRADSAVGPTLIQDQSTSLQSLPYSDHSSPHVDASNTCQTPSDVTLCDSATSCITESPSRADSAVGPTLIQDQSTSLQSLPYSDHSSPHVDASNTCQTPSDVTLCDPATSCITESPSRADSAVGPTLIQDQSTSLQSLPYSDHSSPHVDASNTCQTPSDVTLCDSATSCITESPSRADSAVGLTLIQDQSTSLQSLPYSDHSSPHVDASNTCRTPSDVTLCDPATSCITESPSRADSAVGPSIIQDQIICCQSLHTSDDDSSLKVNPSTTYQSTMNIQMCDLGGGFIAESPDRSDNTVFSTSVPVCSNRSLWNLSKSAEYLSPHIDASNFYDSPRVVNSNDTAGGFVAQSSGRFENSVWATWNCVSSSKSDDHPMSTQKSSGFVQPHKDTYLLDSDSYVPESSDEEHEDDPIPLAGKRRNAVQRNTQNIWPGNHQTPHQDSFHGPDVSDADCDDTDGSDSDYLPESTDESVDENAYSACSPLIPVTRGRKQVISSNNSEHQSNHLHEKESDMLNGNEDLPESSFKNEASGKWRVVNNVKVDKTTCSGSTDHQDSAVSSSSSSNTCTSDIEVLTTSNDGGARRWDKPQFCPFCMTPQKKLPRHLATDVHKDEPQVQQWLATEDPKERAKHLTLMRNYGNFLHNAKVLEEGKGSLIVVYRPAYTVSSMDYLPCTNCFGYFAQSDLWKHKCSQAADDEEPTKKKRKTGLRTASRMLLPSIPGVSKRTHEILSSMKSDAIGRLVRSDQLIGKFAEKLTKKHGHSKDQEGYIRQRLREVARMVLEYRILTEHSEAQLADLICPEKFTKVLEATRRTAGFQEDTNLYTTPSLALKIGHSLKSCAEILRGDALLSGDKALEKNCKAVVQLYNLNWEGEVSHHALRTLQEARRNNPKLLPLTEDVVQLSKYIKNHVAVRHRELQKAVNKDVPKAWTELAELLLTQIIVFNRKRPGEVSKMTLSDYSKCASGTTCVVDGALSALEKALCKALWRVEIVGKRLRTVVVLFTAEIKTALDTLMNRRHEAGIDDSNAYLFSNQRGLGHIRGTDTLREHASKCKAKNPEFLRATRLRKHIATVSQVMNLQENELDLLASFLGHDVRTHREFYRMPESTLQVAKLSKVLLKMDKGDVQGLAGKRLKDVELDPSEEYDTDAMSESSGDEGDDEPEEPMSLNEEAKDADGTKLVVQQQTKRPWTCAEKKAVVKHLGMFLRMRKVPGKGPITALMNAEPQLFKNRTWRNVKDFVRNQVRKQDPMSFLQIR